MPSGLIHFEIHANDLDRAKQFYADLFSWEFTKAPAPIEYWLISTGRTTGPDGNPMGINGGLLAKGGRDGGDGASPNAFVCTIEVQDIDETLEKADKSGATVQMPKDRMPGVGLLAYLKDPEGNIFGILQPEGKS